MTYLEVSNFIIQNEIGLEGNLLLESTDTSERLKSNIIHSLSKNNLLNKLHNFTKDNKSKIRFYPLQNKPESLSYKIYDTGYNKLLLAATTKGLAYIDIYEEDSLEKMKTYFAGSKLVEEDSEYFKQALDYLASKGATTIDCHIKGTEFQLAVWEAVSQIAWGKLSTYKEIAEYIQRPGSTRAVGAAIGRNPVAILIPCHRVIRSDGKWAGFKWGNQTKASLLVYEQLSS